jgi:tetratricopeptide (TPR) repeat protein
MPDGLASEADLFPRREAASDLKEPGSTGGGGRLASGVPMWPWRRWPVLLQAFDHTRKVTISTVIVVACILIGWMAIEATLEDITVVEPITVPKGLEERGYAGASVSQRLIAEARLIGKVSDASEERAKLGIDGRHSVLSTIQIPASGVSIRAMVSVLRTLFGVPDNRIGGEITVIQPSTVWDQATYALTLRIEHGDKRKVVVKRSRDLDQLIKLSAPAILEEIDPYVLAIYLRRAQQPTEAARTEQLKEMNRLVDLMIKSADTDLAKRALMFRGNRYSEAGQLELAVEYYAMSVALDREFAPAYYNWAVALMDRGDYEGAIKKYRTAIVFNPRHEHAYHNWGWILMVSNRRPEALAKLRKLARIAKNPAPAYALLGEQLFEMGQPDEAIAYFRRAVAADPRHAPTYVSWAGSLSQRGDHQEAIGRARVAIALGSATGDAHRVMGAAQENRSDYDGALDWYRQAWVLNRSRPGDLSRLHLYKEVGPP